MAGGIVVKGLVDTECGELVYSATLPGWNRVPMTDFFEKELSIPFYMENDVRAVATFELERYRERKPKVIGHDVRKCRARRWCRAGHQ